MSKSAMKWTAMAGGLVVAGSVWAVSHAASGQPEIAAQPWHGAASGTAGDASASVQSADATAALERRLSAVERRVETLSEQLLSAQSHLLELQRQQIASPVHTESAESVETARDRSEASPVPAPVDAPTTSAYEGLPEPIALRLKELHPTGRIVERGRDGGDGYWWFEVRSEGRLFDVEITDTGDVRKNRRIRG